MFSIFSAFLHSFPGSALPSSFDFRGLLLLKTFFRLYRRLLEKDLPYFGPPVPPRLSKREYGPAKTPKYAKSVFKQSV